MPFVFFFNDTATTEIYTLSLHDALPISCPRPPKQPGNHLKQAARIPHSKRGPFPYSAGSVPHQRGPERLQFCRTPGDIVTLEGLTPESFPCRQPKKRDRKSTRLNSSHGY